MTPLDPLNQFSGDSDPRGQTLGPRGQIKKNAFLPQIPTISVSMDSPGPHESVFEGFGPWGPNFGFKGDFESKGLLEPNSKICTFVAKSLNIGVYGLPWTP